MAAIGITLGGGAVERWLESHLTPYLNVEIAVEGFFSRPTPHLRWLASQGRVVANAVTVPVGGGTVEAGQDRLAALSRWCDAVDAVCVVHPLGQLPPAGVGLKASVPVSLTYRSLTTAVAQVVAATAAHGRPILIEPKSAFLRIPAPIAEPEFLASLCRESGARLILDVPTLLAAERNRDAIAADWLQAVPSDLIGAVRIGGTSLREGRWRRDPQSWIDQTAWTLLETIVAHGHPDLLFLDHDPDDGANEIAQAFERLEAVGRRSRTARHSRPDQARADEVQVRPAPDAALFVLDNEGVFFSEGRRELTLFNTAATLVWCLVEEGHAVAAIVDAYCAAFDVSQGQAREHVGVILRQWFALGYIEDPGSLGGPGMALSDAVAYLLTNPVLRAAFRRSPHAVAQQMNIAPEEVVTFVAIDADNIDDQAREIARDSDAPRPPSLSAADRPNLAPRTMTSVARHYRLVSTTFVIDAGSEATSDVLREALAHLECDDPNPDVVLMIRPCEPGWAIFDGDACVGDLRSAEGIVPSIKQLLRQIAVERASFLLSVHAGAVSFGGGCVLLPAAPGSGKTTLTAGLIHAGATYYSDEIALLDGTPLSVVPVPLSLTVKDGAVEPLSSRFPNLSALPAHIREDHVRVRYLLPPAASMPPPGAAEAARWIVFPRYDPAAETGLTPVSRPVALRRLLDESYIDRQDLDRHKVESVVQWMRGVDCYDLSMSTLDEAVDRLRRLMQQPLGA